MMRWDYRVFREQDGAFVVREVYYDAENHIAACTQDSVEPYGESLEELAQDMEWFKEALTKPVLTLADIPERKERHLNGNNGTNGKRSSIEDVRRKLGLSHPRTDTPTSAL